MSKKRKSWLVVVNIITLSRIIGSIFLFPIFFAYGKIVVGLILAFLFFTDSVDGYLARKYDVSTFFGSIIDSICDKVIIIVSCLLLCFINKFMYICIALEALIFIVNLYALMQNGNIKSSQIGKIKMWVLTICVTLGFFIPYKSTLVNLLIAIPAIIFDLITVIDYIVKASKLKPSIKIKTPKYKKGSEIKYMLFDPEFYKKHKDEKGLISNIYKDGNS